MTLLQVSGLRKSFDETDVLKNIDLTIERGECVFIIGPSGSGKSTLLRCLNRLEEPDEGIIRLSGVEITGKVKDINRIRQKIGMVFQSFNLYPHLTALSNVTLALRRVQKLHRAEADIRGLEALGEVGLSDKAHSYPGTLSGGQQQRVAIARALALKPQLMLFDEPTSALDPELVGGVIDAIRELQAAGMTMVIVSHEMRFAREAANMVVFMDGGEIVERGSPTDVFENTSHPRVADFLKSFT